MKKHFKQEKIAHRLLATAPLQSKPVRAVVRIGNRFVAKPGPTYSVLYVLDKPERRRIRKLMMAGKVDQALAKMRLQMLRDGATKKRERALWLAAEQEERRVA